SFPHAGNAVAGFAQWLREVADNPGRVAIAIEIPRGAVVETLVEHGFHSAPAGSYFVGPVVNASSWPRLACIQRSRSARRNLKSEPTLIAGSCLRLDQSVNAGPVNSQPCGQLRDGQHRWNWPLTSYLG